MIIFKQVLKLEESQLIAFPEGSEILSAHNQNGKLCIWYKFNFQNRNSFRHREICVRGTGHDFEDVNLEFIGTVLLESGSLVLHVFERIY